MAVAATSRAHCASASPFQSKHNSTSPIVQTVSDLEEDEWIRDKIPNPLYEKGLTFTALRHEPPQPFGIGYDTERPPKQDGWKELSQIAYCLSRSLVDGRIHTEHSKHFTITSTIRTGHQVGAQIVVVNKTMVAKIYDPLYYRAVNNCGYPEDVVIEADGDYSREVAAYEQLQMSRDVKYAVPAFYGAWTMDVETQVTSSRKKRMKQTRQVRSILMERLFGECMMDINACDLRAEVRSRILKEVLHAEALIVAAGIVHRDICPHNIIIVGSDYKNPDIAMHDLQVGVKILDFNVAAVIFHPHYEDRRYLDPWDPREEGWPSRLRSPITYRFGHMVEFSAEGWCSNENLEPEKWLWQQFRNDDRYVPVSWDPNDPWKRPVNMKPTEDRYTTQIDSVNNTATEGYIAEEWGNSSSPEYNGSDNSEERNEEKSSDDGSICSEAQ